MRVVSQDGLIDIPYDMSIVNVDYRDKKRIIAAIAGCGEEENLYQMATYSTEAKVIKAMKMLREAYIGKPQRTKSGNVMVDFMANHIFQFPADEDVEVEDV